MAEGKILIVEDEASLLKLETILLTAKGYSVTAVSDGQAALEEVGSNRPDLVILDLMIPVIDGYQVCRRIKENPLTSSLPVIMLTGKKTEEDRLSGERAGADAFITKPFKAAAILEAVEKLLAKFNR